jgi:hypothetical protein
MLSVYAECLCLVSMLSIYAECHLYCVANKPNMLSVVMLNVVMLIVVGLSKQTSYSYSALEQLNTTDDT